MTYLYFWRSSYQEMQVLFNKKKSCYKYEASLIKHHDVDCLGNEEKSLRV